MPDTQLPKCLSEPIEKFDRWSDEYLNTEQENNTLTAPLYHYTHGLGLKGIVESQTIWFTDCRHLNDPSELSYGIGRAHDVISQNATEGDDFGQEFLGCLHDMLSRNTVEFFVASFSRDKDELGQWRAYADNGRGYAIGLAASAINKLVEEPHVYLGPVLYDEREIMKRHAHVIDAGFTIFRDTFD